MEFGFWDFRKRHFCCLADPLYRFLRTQGVGTNAVLDAVHQGRELPILLIPAIFLATLLTHLAGGSAGRVGAGVDFGGVLGVDFGK